jgi:hypothetical protein
MLVHQDSTVRVSLNTSCGQSLSKLLFIAPTLKSSPTHLPASFLLVGARFILARL